MRVPLISGVASILLLTMSGTAAAQFGIGGRIAFIRTDVEVVDEESQRFFGGQIRARMTPRTAFELSLDRRTETNEAETLRIKSTPIQASLLLYPARGSFSPYILGGAGWYAQKFETLAGDETLLSETIREFGWHAGFGAELRMGSHVGLHGDYRYTFLDFGGDDDDDDDDDDGGGIIGGGLVGRLLPGYRGSMWTAGLTFYF